MNKKVIAIVVTYNRESLLAKVIDSLLIQTYSLEKIIVIDNNSNDGTSELISKYSDHSNIIYRNTGANLGGAGGFYHGFKVVDDYDYDYLWLMDDDFQPCNDCLENLVTGDPQGIVQPVRYNLDESCAELSAITYDLSNPFKLNPKGMSLKKYLAIHSETNYLINISVMPFEGPLISKCAVSKIGYPEPKYFIFGDDIDYAVRARSLGIPIVCNLKAKAYRLLLNNQGDDLLSWKGYFMLRNLFHIHRTYGENVAVRLKPWVLALGYVVSCVIRKRFSQVKIIWHALMDSKDLTNTEAFIPGAKRS